MNSLAYADERRALLIELRIMRRTGASKRVVKHMQRLMRKLRTARRLFNDCH
jgi:hypothetical protein